MFLCFQYDYLKYKEKSGENEDFYTSYDYEKSIAEKHPGQLSLRSLIIAFTNEQERLMSTEKSAIGGGFTYIAKPTGQGNIATISIKHALTKNALDVHGLWFISNNPPGDVSFCLSEKDLGKVIEFYSSNKPELEEVELADILDGSIAFHFTFTSLGTVYGANHLQSGDALDLTDYDGW